MKSGCCFRPAFPLVGEVWVGMKIDEAAPFQRKGGDVVDDAGYALPTTVQGTGRKDKLFSNKLVKLQTHRNIYLTSLNHLLLIFIPSGSKTIRLGFTGTPRVVEIALAGFLRSV